MTTEATHATETTAPAAATPAAGPDVATTVARLRKTFATGRTRNLEWRKEQLRALNRLMVENETKIADALEKDLGRSPFEAWLADVASTSGEAAYAAKSVGKWAKRRHRLLEMSQLPGRGWVEYEPYGTVLIIGAWNFPFALTLGPAVGAIAAGNTVLLKPSEVAPASSALMAELVPRYLDNDAIAVIEGDGAVSQELIAQGFDHLLFTGGTEIGRKVYEGAAAHLTPVTLELGGKSPVIVSADADIKVAAKRIAWTKLINSGQICIAPDYVLVEAPIRDQLIDEIQKAVTGFEAENATGGKRIVNERHFNRLTTALAATQGDGRHRRRLGRVEPEHPADRGRGPRDRRAVDDRRDLRPDPAGGDRSKPRRGNRIRERTAQAAGRLPVHQVQVGARTGDQGSARGRHADQPPVVPLRHPQAAVRRRRPVRSWVPTTASSASRSSATASRC